MALKDFAGAIVGGIGQIGSWMGIGEKRQDRRQLEQQQKLTEIQANANRQQADYEQALKMKMWKDTNYTAQLGEATRAGVSKAAAIGGSGTGTQGASVGSVGGGTAADAAATQNAKTATLQQNMQLMSQLALQKAQKENIEADTANKKATATKTGVDTAGAQIDVETKGRTQEDTIRKAQEEGWKAVAETALAQQQQKINEETMQERIKQIHEDTLNKILTNKGIKIENRKKEAEVAIRQFEAKMADSGIAPNTPWYVKMLTDLADKHGLNFLKK